MSGTHGHNRRDFSAPRDLPFSFVDYMSVCVYVCVPVYLFSIFMVIRVTSSRCSKSGRAQLLS